MSRGLKADNSHFDVKLDLRIKHLPSGNRLRVLDAFSGDGRLWGAVKTRTGRKLAVTRCEKKRNSRGLYLRGDNVRLMRGMDLSAFDVIDLDDYGTPIEQLRCVLESEFKGIVFVTMCGKGITQTPSVVLDDLGFPPAWRDVIARRFATGYASMNHHVDWLAKQGVRAFHRHTYLGWVWKIYGCFDAGAIRGEADRVFEICKRKPEMLHRDASRHKGTGAY